jgi:hypothetical protein
MQNVVWMRPDDRQPAHARPLSGAGVGVEEVAVTPPFIFIGVFLRSAIRLIEMVPVREFLLRFFNISDRHGYLLPHPLSDDWIA